MKWMNRFRYRPVCPPVVSPSTRRVKWERLWYSLRPTHPERPSPWSSGPRCKYFIFLTLLISLKTIHFLFGWNEFHSNIEQSIERESVSRAMVINLRSSHSMSTNELQICFLSFRCPTVFYTMHESGHVLTWNLSIGKIPQAINDLSTEKVRYFSKLGLYTIWKWLD